MSHRRSLSGDGEGGGTSLAGRSPPHHLDTEAELRLLSIYRQLGQLQSFVWLNYQAFSKIMKKYDKHMNYRDTPNAKSAEFDRRLESEPFKSTRLDG